jgi:hypothetical protein
LYDLKEHVLPGGAEVWMNYTDYNLYGDPSVGLFTFGRGDLRMAVE